MKYNLKKNWQIIVICILTLFSFSKCTQSCNRGTETNNVKTEYSEYKQKNDSLLLIYKDSIVALNYKLNVANSQIDMMKSTLNDLKLSADAMAKINDNLSKNRPQVIIKKD